MAGAHKAKGTKKGRKIGRNAAWCQSYRARGQRERNKIAKVLRHIKRYGATDHMAVHFFNNMPARAAAGLETITPVKSKHKHIPPKRPMLVTQMEID